MDISSTAASAATTNPTEARRRHAADVPTDVLFAILGCVFLLVLIYQLVGLHTMAIAGTVAVIVLIGVLVIAMAIAVRGADADAASAAAASSSDRAGSGAMTASVAWPPGMDVAAISELPAAFRFKREDAAAEGWAQCPVCLGLVRVGESVRRLPACGHLFHTRCVDQWLRGHATCPLCRAAVVREELPPV